MADNTNMNMQDMCMDWNDTIENDGMDFTPLPAGTYEFEVTEFARARHPGSANLPPCNKAALMLTAFGPDGKTVRIFADLFLHRKMEWKLAEFFRSIGQKKHGERFTPDWNDIVGRRGRAELKVSTYTDRNGNERSKNEVDKYLDYDEALMSKPSGQVSMAEVEGTGFTDSFEEAEADIPFDF